MTTTTNYAELLGSLRDLAARAAGVEGADDIGAFHPIPMTDKYRGYGEFSSLSEFLDDFADVLGDFLGEHTGELEGWHA